MTPQKAPAGILWEAISAKDLAQVEELIAERPELLEQKLPSFGTWLHLAARHGNLPIFEFFIDAGFELNLKNETRGQTALFYAGLGDNFEVAEYMLAQGALMDVSDSSTNPLLAAIGISPRIVRLLLENGIDSSIKYSNENMINLDAISLGHEKGDLESVQIIAEFQASGDKSVAQALIAEGKRAIRPEF